MKRTIDIVTTARAKGVELPEGWLENMCPRCYGCHIGGFRGMCPWPQFCNQAKSHTNRELRYLGPDLELPENIHHAFTVADALSRKDYRASVIDESGAFKAFLFARGGGHFIRTAPERHLALIAACEAALGIQHEKEIAT